MDNFEKDSGERLNEAIVDRKIFTYKYWRGWVLRHFGSRLCCCCRVKSKREDWLWKDAKTKLNIEIDILDIVKRLRVHQFASEMTLKPSQRDLISFFDDYKLKEEDDINIDLL